MSKVRGLGLKMQASALAISLVLGGTAATFTAMGTLPALAQDTLTPEQAAAVQASVTAALNSVSPGLSGPALAAAQQNAIANAEANAIGTYGAGAAGAVTQTVLSTADAAGVPAGVVGAGLGQASVSVASSSGTAAANAIGTTLANEGTGAQVNSFTNTASALGAPASVIFAASSGPAVTGSTGGAGGGGGGIGGTGGLTGATGGGGGAGPAGLAAGAFGGGTGGGGGATGSLGGNSAPAFTSTAGNACTNPSCS